MPTQTIDPKTGNTVWTGSGDEQAANITPAKLMPAPNPGQIAAQQERLKTQPWGNFIQPTPQDILTDPILGQEFLDKHFPQTPPAQLGYQPTFWENPQRVARYVLSQRALPEGTPNPSWMDPKLGELYDYLDAKNNHLPWYYWDHPAAEDPVRQVMQGIPLPPQDQVRPNELHFYEQQQPAMGTAPAPSGAGTPQTGILTGIQAGSDASGGYQPNPEVKQDLIAGLPADQFNQLNWWQKVLRYGLPLVNSAMMAQMGFKIGSTFGAPGAAIGAAAGAALQPGIDYATEKDANGNPVHPFLNPVGEAAQGVMNGLMWGAVQAQKSMGLIAETVQSIGDPQKYGGLEEIYGSLEKLKAAYDAGYLGYQAFSNQLTPGESALANLGGAGVGIPATVYKNLFTNAPVENWDLEHPVAEKWTPPNGMSPLGYALTTARRELQSNPNLTAADIEAEWGAKFGIFGQLRTMIGQIVIDPMHALPHAETFAGEKLADVAGNKVLARSFSEAHDVLDAARRYGVELRQMPQDEAAQYGALSRWVGGLDQTGAIKELKPGTNNILDRMLGLDAKSRANELLNTSVDGLGTMMHQFARDEMGNLDPDRAMNLVETMAKTLPGQAMEFLDGSPAPRWFASAEGQSVATAIREQLPVLHEMLDQYKISRPSAAILSRVAEAMGVTPEKLIADFHTADPKQAQDLFTQFRVALAKRAADGDRAAAGMIEAFTKDPNIRQLSGLSLKKMADLFSGKDGAAFDPEHQVLLILDQLEQGVGKFAVKYFGVQPAPTLMRFAEMVKKAQGRVLLGVNPSYFINNALNNVVTMSWDGVMGITSHGQVMKDMNDLGITATRLRQGIGAADIGELGVGGEKVGRTIRQAGRGTDWIQGVDDLVGRAPKLTPFTLLSGHVEQWSSEMAMHTALMEFWNQRWTVGDGFRRMTPEDRIALNAVEPGLAERIEQAIARGKNRGQIEKEVFTGLQRKSVHDVLSPAEKQVINELAPSALDKLDNALKDAQTDADVQTAINETRLELEQAKTNQVAQHLEEVVQGITEKVAVEKAQGLLDEAQNIHHSFLEFWRQHSLLMDDLAERAAAAPDEFTRSNIWNTGLREAGERWHQFTNIEGAKWLGMYRGLKAEGTPEYEAYLQSMFDLHNFRSAFFTEREQATVDYLTDLAHLRDSGMKGRELKAAKAALWQKRGERLNKAYVDFLLNEDAVQQEIDANFIAQYAAQFPDDPAAEIKARTWRETQQQLRRKQAMAEAVYRHGQLPEALTTAWGQAIDQVLVDQIRTLNHGLPDWRLNPADRPAIAKRFYEEVYRPLIGEMIDANRGSSPEHVDVPPPEPTVPPTTPAPAETPAAPEAPAPEQGASVPVMITAEMRRRLSDLGYSNQEVREMTPQDAWDILRTNRQPATTAAPAQPGERRVSSPAQRREWLLTHDQMTRLKNRFAFEGDASAGVVGDFEQAKQAALAAGSPPPVVALTDLRGLHQTNNNLGYAAGDAYLQAMAKAFQDEGIDGYRYGGDEFAAIFTDPNQANEQMSRVMARLDNAIIKVGENEYVGAKAHYGIGEDPSAAAAAATAAKRADPRADIFERGTYQLQPRAADQTGTGNPAAEGLGAGPAERGGAPAQPATTPPEPQITPGEHAAITRAEQAHEVARPPAPGSDEEIASRPLQREDGTYDREPIAYLPNNDSEVLPAPLADAIKKAASDMLGELTERHPERAPAIDSRTGEPVTTAGGTPIWRNHSNQIASWIDDLGALESRKSAENSLRNIVEGKKGRSPKYDVAMRQEAIKRLLGESNLPYDRPEYGFDGSAAWLLGQKDTAAAIWDYFVNELGPDASPDNLGVYADQIQEYWIETWIPKHAIETMAAEEALAAADGLDIMDQVAIDEAGTIHTADDLRTAARANPMVVRKMAAEEFQIANPADAHIMNIVKQVYPGVRKFDEISPEMARDAFTRNKATHAAVEQGKKLYTPTMAEVAKQLEKNIETLRLAAPKKPSREAAIRHLYAQYGDPNYVKSLMVIYDQIADNWAIENGKVREDWYANIDFNQARETIGGFENGMKQLSETERKSVTVSKTDQGWRVSWTVDEQPGELPYGVTIEPRKGRYYVKGIDGTDLNVLPTEQAARAWAVNDLPQRGFNASDMYGYFPAHEVSRRFDTQAQANDWGRSLANGVYLYQRAAESPVTQAMRDTFGITDNYRKAGFIAPNGDLIDLSQGQPTRTMEHVDAARKIFNQPGLWDKEGIAQLAQESGAIRFGYYGAKDGSGDILLDIYNRPSRAQIDKVDDLFISQGLKGAWIMFDIRDEHGTVVSTGNSYIYADQFRDWMNYKVNKVALNQGNRGVTTWLDDGRAFVQFFKNADVSTGAHEVAHTLLPMLGERDLAITREWLETTHGLKLSDDWQYYNVQAHELFSKGLERVLAEGIAPEGASPEMRSVFIKMRDWLMRIYHQIKGSNIDVEISPAMREVYNKWLTDNPKTRRMLFDEYWQAMDTIKSKYPDQVAKILEDVYGNMLSPEQREMSRTVNSIKTLAKVEGWYPDLKKRRLDLENADTPAADYRRYIQEQGRAPIRMDLNPPAQPAAPAGAPAAEPTAGSYKIGDLVDYKGKVYEIGFVSPHGNMVRLQDALTHEDAKIKAFSWELNPAGQAPTIPEGLPKPTRFALIQKYKDAGDVYHEYQMKGTEINPWLRQLIDRHDPTGVPARFLEAYNTRKQIGEQAVAEGWADELHGQAPQPVGDVTPQPVTDVWTNPAQAPEQLNLNTLMENLAARLENPAMDFIKSGDYEAWFKQVTGMDLSDEANMNLAYDTLEGAFNLAVRAVRARMDASGTPLVERLKTMDFFEQRITKARRTIAKMKLQQFSTPLTISEAAGYAADVRPGDIILEPTAGTANLVDRFYGKPGVQVLVNEFDAGRRSVLTALGYDPTGTDLMGREWVVDAAGKKLPPLANVTITNPPWGAYSTGKYGKAVTLWDDTKAVQPNDWSQRFTFLTLQRMPEGGRFVGIMPVNWLYTVDRTTRKLKYNTSQFITYLGKNYEIKAVIESPEGAYDTRATGVGSLLVVVDKVRPGKSPRAIMAYGDEAPKDWEEYASLVEKLGQGGEYARRPEDILNGQGAIPHATVSGGEPAIPRPTTGPDATGLVDPAARRGDAAADAANIGALTPAEAGQPAGPAGVPAGPAGQPGAPERAAAPGEPGAAASVPSVPSVPGAAGEPAVPPAYGPGEGQPLENLGNGAALAGGANELGGVLEPAGRGAAGTETGHVEQPAGTQGHLDPAVVEGYAPGIQGRIQRFFAERSKAFTQKYTDGTHAASESGSFTRYVGRSPLADTDPVILHPAVVVETKSLAGVKYPDLDPNFRPSPTVMKAYRNRVLSLDGNLDPIWAAIQQNDKQGSGFLVADDVGMGKSRTAAGFILDRIEKGKKRILYVTKGEQNVDNIKNVELPGVYGGSVDENGGWIEESLPKEMPFERLVLSGETTPDAKKGLKPIPTFEKPAVYFVNDTQFKDFEKQILELKPDVIVVDEAHMFKGLDTERAVSWNNLHTDWLDRKANILYLSATPGTDLADMRYLYGLRVWAKDGFSDWVNIITGKESPEAVKARQADMDKLDAWSTKLAAAREQVDATPKDVKLGWYGEERKGYTLADKLWVGYTGRSKEYGVYMIDPQGRVYQGLQVGTANSETEALLIADLMVKSGDRLSSDEQWNGKRTFIRAQDQYRELYPEPKIASASLDNAGIKDVSDVVGKKEKGKKWGAGRSAFEYTVPPAHTEQIMRELKTGGYYMSRDIIRSGVDFNVKEYRPSPDAIANYNRRVELYQDIIRTFDEFAKENHGPKKGAAMYGVTGDIQADAKRQLFHMRLPGILAEADAALKRGERVVISLVSVGEVDWEKGNLPSAISKINTLHVEKSGDGYTAPEEIPEALIRIADLKDKLEALGKTPSPVDVISEHFGRDKVKAIIGEVAVNQRKNAVRDFQNNRVPVIIISGAGKTGINLHDTNGNGRVHLIVGDYEWSSTTFKQELGRVDRTGEITSPIVTVLHNGSAGEKKFLATISNRMKGLGAASKGAAESTGTSALTNEFELGSDLDKMALEYTWSQLTPQERSKFLDKYFSDPTVPGASKPRIDGTAEAIKKFTKAIQSIPFDEANAIWQKFMDTRDALNGDEKAAGALLNVELAQTKNYEGNVIRQTQLSGNLRLTEVKDPEGHKFGILDGILTPVMNKVKGYIRDPYSTDLGNGWMRWGRVYDPETKSYYSGLVVPITKVKDLAAGFGQSIGGMHTIDNALTDLQAGDRIKLHGSDMHEWTLYLGRGGDREGKVVIDGAKMAQRDALLKNGARYSAVGNYFWLPEDNVPEFLRRFPINNETPKARPSMAQSAAPGSSPEWLREQIARYQREMADLEARKDQMNPWEYRNTKANIQEHIDNFTLELNEQQPAAPAPNVTPPPAPAPVAAGAPLGSMDGVSNMPTTEALLQGWGQVDEALRHATDGLTGARAQTQGQVQGLNDLDPVSLKRVKGYLSQVYADMADTKMAALRYAEARRDFALLNYSRRTGMDNLLSSLLPYQFWYTHSMLNWAARAVNRPGMLSNYIKLNQFVQNATNQPGFPTRLKGKMGIHLPFLPKWMGEGIYMDPMAQVYPFEQLMRPITNLAQQKTLEEHEAEYVLDDQVRSGEITAQDAAAAKQTRQGTVWDKAYAQAVNQVAGNIQNPTDFIFSLSGPMLPVTIAYDVMTGRKDQISQLPVTKFIQNMTSMVGLGGPQGLNIEAPLRRAAGLPEMPFNDMRLGRMLSNMAAEGLISADDAERAMINKSGPAYEAAQKRVAQMGLIQYLGAPLAVDLFPEGEQEQRQIQQEYGKALDAAKGGDTQALTKFYDQYPEYEARSMAFKDPQTQIKQFLISDVWNQYNQLSTLDKRLVSDQLGTTFQDAFLNKETRSYDSIPAETLAKWAQAMGGKPLDVFGKSTQAGNLNGTDLPIQLAEPGVAASYQKYSDTKKNKFPGIGDLETMLYNLPQEQQAGFRDLYPQLSEYSKWHNAYLASHPEITPYAVGKNSELAGVDPRIQQQVFTFRAAKAELFPDLAQMEKEYFAIDKNAKSGEAYPQTKSQAKRGVYSYKSQRAVYLEKHPRLAQAWNWQTTYIQQNPDAAQYIASPQRLASMQQAVAQGKPQTTLTPEAMQRITSDEALLRQLYLSAFGAGSKLSAGASIQLENIWLDLGKPEGDFETWVEDVIKPTFQVKA